MWRTLTDLELLEEWLLPVVGEDPMNWSKSIRQTHRWLSMAFRVLVPVDIVLNFVAAGQEELALWVGGFTLLPLALLMLTGLYLFALPYVSRRRSGEPTTE